MNEAIANAFERLKKRVEIDGNGCWNWLGAVTKDMYGTIRVGDSARSTHRVAYMAVHGAIPRGKVIRHACDNRRCCNPAHLLTGDHEDNTADIIERKRHAVARRVLSADEVSLAVSMWRAGSTKRQVAEALRCNWYIASAAIDSAGGAPRKPGRPKGSRNLRSRVQPEAKDRMRELYATGSFTQQQLAEQFGCDQTYVSLIVRGRK